MHMMKQDFSRKRNKEQMAADNLKEEQQKQAVENHLQIVEDLQKQLLAAQERAEKHEGAALIIEELVAKGDL